MASSLISHPVTIFSLGTTFGATCVYIFLRIRLKQYKPPPAPTNDVISREEYRLIIAVRNDLKMQRGKVAAQCGHAAVAAYAKAMKLKPNSFSQWLRYGSGKITVKIESEQELFDLQRTAEQHGVLASIVRDAGQTQVEPGARTVIAIGPAPKSTLDKITGHLKLY